MISNFKIKLISRRTRQERVLTLQEFKKDFYNELRQAINTYSTHREQSLFYERFYKNHDFESDFYNSLQFNFNN
mgnify:FL=1